MHRRSLIGSALCATVVAALGGISRAIGREGDFPFALDDEEWRARLSPEQYEILREHGTEWAYSSPLNDEYGAGVFHCAGCAAPLFSSETKYDSHTGWPSFHTPLAGAVGESVDMSFGMVRTEVHCANCGGHQGHIFPDGPPPTGLRYCINGLALDFVPA